MDIQINTHYDENVIRQITTVDNGVTGTREERMIELQDEGVEEALSKLGYLNPEQAKYRNNVVNALQNDKVILKRERDKLIEENKELLEALKAIAGAFSKL